MFPDAFTMPMPSLKFPSAIEEVKSVPIMLPLMTFVVAGGLEVPNIWIP